MKESTDDPKKMTQSHYSLRWNNHQTHILSAFEALLQAETLVDVTLVCAETSVRAHKVVLSACSPFFQRIFSENPCKHPVIVLKDFNGWEVQAIVDFMYKGEISVIQEQLQSLIKAAESLQVRGLATQDPFDKESTSIINQTPTPSASPNDFDRNYYSNTRFPNTGVAPKTPSEQTSPFSPSSAQNNFETPIKLPHMPRLSFPDTLLPRPECQSPIPRRKQARPRRRSGEMCGPQDLSIPPPKSESPAEETAENLCIKKQIKEQKREIKEEKSRTPEMSIGSPEMDLSLPSTKDFRTSPISMHPILSLKQEIDSHSPLPFPPMPSVSALTMTPPHSKFFGLDSPLGLFPPGLEGCRNPLFDMPDPRTTPDSQMFVKKKRKSLKLEQLRKDCIGGPNAAMDILNLGSNTNTNNPCKPEREPEPIQPNTRPSSTEDQHPQHSMFNPFTHSFYPDFGSAFPIPVSMIHLLPQSEKSREQFSQQQQMEDDSKERAKDVSDEMQPDLFRPPALSVEDRRELVQQNGQD
ncbi:unnamed protein product [Diabrotica balteata]|uniref:BTB domain-containing protein n=1 Tax=Diabrotica balteata TaxID=107213 RepID=A0A9N9XBV3_DIABA|nr:unnamed protein product [Diabrotica balteata]